MDIRQAKAQVESAVRAYLSHDERGRSRIPQRMQRPIIIFGPPGVGKTAIVSQVADELGINFVSYSITHHTRQSALGLPYITTEELGGLERRISDYTMSEIIASVHRACKQTGVGEGILFLDEVNCVSETLAPAMLQFLQFKTFGMHSLPRGWTIVCAGNPTEYNRAAREFDPAMLDRIKRIDVEPDVAVWQEYATTHGVHPAITTFLEAKPASFYMVKTHAKGARLVTARGWDDLSRMILAYEAEGLAVDVELVGQYLQDDATAREFFAYYDLFCKYRDDYKVASILEGEMSSALVQRAADAPFSERVALVGLLLDALLDGVHDIFVRNEALDATRTSLVGACKETGDGVMAAIGRSLDMAKAACERFSGITERREQVNAERVSVLSSVNQALISAKQGQDDLAQAAKDSFNALVDEHARHVSRVMKSVDCAFRFLDAAFGEQSQEALILVTKLSADAELVRAVASYGSEEYIKHNKDLLLDERKVDLLNRIDRLEQTGLLT